MALLPYPCSTALCTGQVLETKVELAVPSTYGTVAVCTLSLFQIDGQVQTGEQGLSLGYVDRLPTIIMWTPTRATHTHRSSTIVSTSANEISRDSFKLGVPVPPKTVTQLRILDYSQKRRILDVTRRTFATKTLDFRRRSNFGVIRYHGVTSSSGDGFTGSGNATRGTFCTMSRERTACWSVATGETCSELATKLRVASCAGVRAVGVELGLPSLTPLWEGDRITGTRELSLCRPRSGKGSS